MQRRIAFTGVWNFRDIGGYETLDGRMTRWGRVFRPDSLRCLTADDLESFDRLGIRAIFDLRRAQELEEFPGPRPFVHLPLPSRAVQETDATDLINRPVAESLAYIVVDRAVVGWIEYDVNREWLEPGEVNLGYFLVASARGYGYATRAVNLLLRHLAAETDYRVATLLIDLRDECSLAVASRADFELAEDIGGGTVYLKPAIR